MPKERVPYYYALLLLNVGGMIGFCVTGDLFNLYVFTEILSLSGYALVAISGEPTAAMASFKYLLMGAISSLLILTAIGIVLAITGSLNMADIAQRLGSVALTGSGGARLRSVRDRVHGESGALPRAHMAA